MSFFKNSHKNAYTKPFKPFSHFEQINLIHNVYILKKSRQRLG